ncbi:DUF1622 domain-containing protein [Roseibium salinum]|uniref:DUF1622 domain-containing protein n=1 Tax=Roseibium salinum TaxID=1604349 RepID=A0ABT3R3M9_9HYPH|nr:DUF1622 domain-containing protein [Roseibium sp. DSM 29163]MCX2723592.1 DUF1622 domain-containing protein [Roseibium sp. DSM 29163]
MKVPIAAGATALILSVIWLSEVAAQETGTVRGAASHNTAIWLDTALHWTVRGIEMVGIAAVVIGAIAASTVFLFRAAREGPSKGIYQQLRASLGRSILLGLEFLVAADIINTVAIDPTLESVAVLAAVVAVRTFLSIALEVEIEGKWPWRKNGE